jgi:Hom_end-associated Hint
MEDRFDKLAKRLAEGVSRREVLRQVGGGLAGTLLAAVGVTKAWGQTDAVGRRCVDCCRFREQFFGEAFGPCVSACAQNKGGRLPGDPCTSDAQCCYTTCEEFPDQGGSFCVCFIAGTRIRMSDGSERPIEQIRIGDRLLGPDGEANRVVELRRPQLGNRKLYALNGSRHFLTDGHPFMTGDGWKSLDPEATMRENPGLPVGRLEVGDLLVAVRRVPVLAAAGGAGMAEPAVPELFSIPVAQIEGREADPETPLFNLHVEGRHVYFADGFLVHNK